MPEVPPDVGGGAQPDLDDRPAERTPSVARRRIAQTLKVLAFLFVFVYFGLPAIGGAGKAVDELSDVQPLLLVSGVALQFAAFFAYSQLTRAALPRHSVGLFQVFRIQLATRGLTNVVPGGSAAGNALGYRLLTLGGVRGADAGFGLATAALGSAVTLNVMLWVGLVATIPARGVNPLYGTAALVGAALLGTFMAIVLGLMKGRRQSERAVRWFARNARLDEEHAARNVRYIAARLSELIKDPVLCRRVLLWAAANWVLDMASLWVFIRAFGPTPPLDGLVVAFGIANLVAALPLTPGGLGVVEAAYLPLLTAAGVPRSVAALGVSSYRLVQFWLPIPLGALAYLSLVAGPASLKKARTLGGLRRVAEEMADTAGSRIEWAERYGHRPGDPTVPLERPDEPGRPTEGPR